MGTSTVPAGTSIVTVDTSSHDKVRTVFDAYDHALTMVDPDLRQTFLSRLLPLIRPYLSSVELRNDTLPPRTSDPWVILAFGGGTVLDAAKTKAAELGVDWIAVPSKPTSAAFSATASVKQQGRVSTRVVSPPRSVLLLADVICATPLDLLTAELHDTWSFQTAVADIVLDAMTNGTAWNAGFVPLFNAATCALAELRPADLRHPAPLERFMGVQCLLASVTNAEHTTRYVSGAEHLLAHSLLMRGCSLAHGHQVCIGIAVARSLQCSRASLYRTVRDFGLLDLPDPAWRRIRAWAATCLRAGRVEQIVLDQALDRALTVRKTHRYTVLDTASQGECRAALRGLLA
jgi:glycerol dehydrogenase-like iron-containing ADH family enzyme